MKKLTTILIAILFALSLNGLCFAQAQPAPAKPTVDPSKDAMTAPTPEKKVPEKKKLTKEEKQKAKKAKKEKRKKAREEAVKSKPAPESGVPKQ
jgi:hypothetical protein